MEKLPDTSLDLAAVDVTSYISEAQPFILQAIKDPSFIDADDLAQVALVVINRAWQDKGYEETAAAICCHISQETERFCASVSDTCSSMTSRWAELRQVHPEGWLSYVVFVAQLASKRPAFVGLLYAALEKLARPPCVLNVDEVSLLAVVLKKCGASLQTSDETRMDSLMCDVRDAFLNPQPTSADVRTALMLCLELFAANWRMPAAACSYYSAISALKTAAAPSDVICAPST